MPSIVHGMKNVFKRHFPNKLMLVVAQIWFKPKEYISSCGIYGVRAKLGNIFGHRMSSFVFLNNH